jgi:hypothetical protein
MTLASLKHVGAQLVVVDDSSSRLAQAAVRRVTFSSGGNYQASAGQRRLLRTLRISASRGFFHPLGSSRWDTGYVRNHILLLAASLKCKKSMFVDDDIVMRDSTLYAKLNRRLANNDFVGSRATGLIDDSVLGHLQRSMGKAVDEYVSAGFLAFRPQSVRYPFMNFYNEDWIWLYLHSRRARISKTGTVYQVPTFQSKGFIREAKFQEVGEFLVTGVEAAVRNEQFELDLSDVDFWDHVSGVRTREIEEMISESEKKRFVSAVRAAKAVLRTQRSIRPVWVASMFREFFMRVGEWRGIMETAQRSDILLE